MYKYVFLLVAFSSLAHADNKQEFIQHLVNKLPRIICEGQKGYAPCLGIGLTRCRVELGNQLEACAADKSVTDAFPEPFADLPEGEVKKHIIFFGQCAVRRQIIEGGYGDDKLWPCGGIKN
jgi:hypothetical protein